MKLTEIGSYRAMRVGIYHVTLIFLLASLPMIPWAGGLYAHERPSQADRALGFNLETAYWIAVQNKDIEEIEKKTSAIFQGNSAEGLYTRREQIEGLTQGVELESFLLENFISTRAGEVIINSYDLVTDSTGIVDGPVVSVWLKDRHCWKLISQSYFPFP